MLALAAAPLVAGEYVVLASGAVLYAERREVVGEMLRLYKGDGFIELPRSLAVAFEPVAAAEQEKPQSPEPAPLPDPRALISQTGSRYGGEDFVRLLDSVARVESGYRFDAVSPRGARGLMQLMPETARELQADPDDPAQNAEAGARLLRDLLLKYKDDPYQVRLALAAYNAGPGAVERYGGVPPYRETLAYIERVLSAYRAALLRKPSSAAR